MLSPTATALDATRALSQSLHRIWQMQQGLPQATIYRIRQTADGYLWLATQTGLVRFDGVRFTSIDDLGNGVSLHNVWVHDLLEDDQHNLWLATEGQGLIRWRNGTAQQFRRPDGLPSDTVHSLLFDSRGALWICTPDGLARYDHGSFKTLSLPTRDPQVACEADDDDVIYVGGAGPSLSVINPQSPDAPVTSLPLKSLPATTTVLSLLAAPGGELWVGTTDGLVHLDRAGAQRRFTTDDNLAGNTVYCLERGHDQCVWAGTDNGFTRLRADEIDDSFRSKDGLSQSTVHTLCEDREGSLWAGTKHGLDQFLDRRTVPFTTSEGLPSNDTGPVLQGRGDTVWVGTIGAGLSRFDGHRFTTLTASQGLASDTIHALATTDAGDVWVGTDRGLTHLRDAKPDRTYTTADGLPSNAIRSLAIDPDGALWIGTDAGPALFRASRLQRLPGNQPVQALIARHDGSVLASVGDGTLSSLKGEDGGSKIEDSATQPSSIFHPPSSLSHIDCFFEDPTDHHLWIGTRGRGLFLLDGDRLINFTVRDGLYDDDLYGIVADDQDKLWFACSKGIFSVHRADLFAFAAGKLTALNSDPFSPTDALRTIECKSDVQPAAARAHDGTLWFATIHGAIAIDPGHLQRNRPPPPVVIEEVTVNGQTQHPAAGVTTLPPGLNNLQFGYTALSLLSPGRTTFRYRLEGFDKDWVDAGNRREAFYTNLPPGPYRFRVMATVIDGVSAEATNPVSLQLQPYFYQRPIFIPLCVLLAASIGYLIYWRRIRFIRANAQAVLNERSRIARELHDTLMQGFAGVTMELQAFASRLPDDSERKTELNEIIRDAGICLREARQSVTGLRTNVVPTTSTLATSLATAARQVTEDKPVRLKLALNAPPNPLPPEVEYNLLRIAQEALTNAVKHSRCRTVELTLNSTPDTLHLAVTDDGTGITAPAGPGHYGLVGMNERAAQIRATLDIQSQPNRGTTVQVSLPLAPSHRHPLASDTPALPAERVAT